MPKQSIDKKYEEYKKNAEKYSYVEIMTQKEYAALEDRPLKAIRKFCTDCMGGQSHEIKRCTAYECSLWPYRLGFGAKVAMKDRPDLMSKDHVKYVLNKGG